MKLSSIEASFNPHGLRSLVVDHNLTSLLNLSKMLQFYHYQVTECRMPSEALSLIRNGVSKFDIVIISGLDFSSDMKGVEFLEIIIRETDLPVVIVSADDRKDTIMECVKKGACAYLTNPASKEEIQLLWQHVARKKILSFRLKINSVESGEPDSSVCGEDKDFCGSSDGCPVVVMDRSRKDREDDQEDKVERKKQRLVWTDELHQHFLDAVDQLGNNNAVPKKVLELMNVPGITRENVASHLQKYRLNLKKQSGHCQENFSMPNSDISQIRHNQLFQKSPSITAPLLLDQLYYMDLGSNPTDSYSKR